MNGTERQRAGTTETSACARGSLGFSSLFQGLTLQKTGPELAVAAPVWMSIHTALQPQPHPVAREAALHSTAEGTAPGMALLVAAMSKSISENLSLSLQNKTFPENMYILVC